jgi:hypothetical protein
MTFAAFCFLWSLWSAEALTDWIWMLGAVTEVDAAGVALVAAVLGVIFLLGGRDWSASRTPSEGWRGLLLQPMVRASAMLLLLVALAQPAVRAVASPSIAAGIDALHATSLNTRDAALQHRGYYEQLEVRPGVNAAPVLDRVARQGPWDDLASLDLVRPREDLMLRDLKPSVSAIWNGRRFSTNRWGMRDRDYAREKPAGVLRVVILGPSHVMGNGVGDGETFEALVEERLNREHVPAGYSAVEILNFAVDGYSLPQQLAMLEQRALDFAPDLVIVTRHQRDRLTTQRFLVRIASEGRPVADARLQALMESAGLTAIGRGPIPVPFAPLRRVAGWAGLDTRMPTGELSARAGRIADEVVDLTMARLAELTRARGGRIAVLALNAVIDDEQARLVNRAAIDREKIPLIDLIGIFPEADRPRLRVAPWDDHPNAEGHRLIAGKLYGRLVPILDAAASPGSPTTN